jgi:hypothetical protein
LRQFERDASELEHKASLVHTVTTVDAQVLDSVVMVLALGVAAGLVVLLVARHVSLQRSVSIEGSGPLSEVERRSLRTWARRTKVSFIGCMLFVVLNGVLLILTNPAPLWLGWSGLGTGVVVVGAGLALHFSGRCPRCGYIIGLQSPLLLPYRCERCKTPFR